MCEVDAETESEVFDFEAGWLRGRILKVEDEGLIFSVQLNPPHPSCAAGVERKRKDHPEHINANDNIMKMNANEKSRSKPKLKARDTMFR